jgi:hypothetical protein
VVVKELRNSRDVDQPITIRVEMQKPHATTWLGERYVLFLSLNPFQYGGYRKDWIPGYVESACRRCKRKKPCLELNNVVVNLDI